MFPGDTRRLSLSQTRPLLTWCVSDDLKRDNLTSLEDCFLVARSSLARRLLANSAVRMSLWPVNNNAWLIVGPSEQSTARQGDCGSRPLTQAVIA
jgi:hypothetical protein